MGTPESSTEHLGVLVEYSCHLNSQGKAVAWRVLDIWALGSAIYLVQDVGKRLSLTLGFFMYNIKC